MAPLLKIDAFLKANLFTPSLPMPCGTWSYTTLACV